MAPSRTRRASSSPASSPATMTRRRDAASSHTCAWTCLAKGIRRREPDRVGDPPSQLRIVEGARLVYQERERVAVLVDAQGDGRRVGGGTWAITCPGFVVVASSPLDHRADSNGRVVEEPGQLASERGRRHAAELDDQVREARAGRSAGGDRQPDQPRPSSTRWKAIVMASPNGYGRSHEDPDREERHRRREEDGHTETRPVGPPSSTRERAGRPAR